jgi:hypothetical protein
MIKHAVDDPQDELSLCWKPVAAGRGALDLVGTTCPDCRAELERRAARGARAAHRQLDQGSCWQPGGSGLVIHTARCRPARPLCRWARRARWGICECTAYHYPHRRASGACKHGDMPDILRRAAIERGWL